MDVKVTDNPFSENPEMTKSVGDDIFADFPFEYFDKDGFDLNVFEAEVYKRNDVEVQPLLNRNANHYVWFDHEFKGKGVYFDHSLLMCRRSYSGELAEQIGQKSQENPLLNKLLMLTPKWGIDVNVEFVFDDGSIMEVFHHESDYYDFDEYCDNKAHLEKFVADTDFEDAANVLLRDKHLWNDLCGDDQTDYKARYFGFNRAYTTQKVI
ncbi:MAG: hypothetical protein CMP47_12440 [Rickettsiales bacterium]|nr:hypothetical protein [Rickettsiales bacterium]